MTLHPLSTVVPDDTGLLCRQSRLHGAIGTTLMSAMFVAPPVFCWWVEAPWVVIAFSAVFALLIVPLLIGDLRARFRPTNWVLWVTGDGLWINVRSYQNHALADAETVAFLGWEEVASVGSHTHSYSTPGDKNARSIRHQITSLDIELNHGDTAALRDAIAAERRAEAPQRSWFGVIHVRSRATHFPVSVPADETIRIAWRGGQGHAIAPSLRRVLQELSARIEIDAPEHDSRDDWQELSEEELNRQILELVQSGAHFDAMKLLRRRKGYSIRESRDFVDGLVQRL